MQRIRSTLLLAFSSFALFYSSEAFADVAPDTAATVYRTDSGSAYLLWNAPLNASDATRRTITAYTQKKVRKLRVTVLYTHSGASHVTAAMTCAEDGFNYAAPQTRKCEEGDCLLYDMIDRKPVSGSKKFTIEYDVGACESVQILFGGTSAGANDKVKVTAIGLVGA